MLAPIEVVAAQTQVATFQQTIGDRSEHADHGRKQSETDDARPEQSSLECRADSRNSAGRGYRAARSERGSRAGARIAAGTRRKLHQHGDQQAECSVLQRPEETAHRCRSPHLRPRDWRGAKQESKSHSEIFLSARCPAASPGRQPAVAYQYLGRTISDGQSRDCKYRCRCEIARRKEMPQLRWPKAAVWRLSKNRRKCTWKRMCAMRWNNGILPVPVTTRRPSRARPLKSSTPANSASSRPAPRPCSWFFSARTAISARSSEVRARANLAEAIANLDRATACTLKAHQIKLDQ